MNITLPREVVEAAISTLMLNHGAVDNADAITALRAALAQAAPASIPICGDEICADGVCRCNMVTQAKPAPTTTVEPEVLRLAVDIVDACMDVTQVEPEDNAAWQIVRKSLGRIVESQQVPMTVEPEVEELLHRYWCIAYVEGETGVSSGDEANEVLFALRKALGRVPMTVEPEVVRWEYRFFYAPNTGNPGWGKWQEVEPKGLQTLDDSVAEMRHYIAAGYEYELRALGRIAPAAQQPKGKPCSGAT